MKRLALCSTPHIRPLSLLAGLQSLPPSIGKGAYSIPCRRVEHSINGAASAPTAQLHLPAWLQLVQLSKALPPGRMLIWQPSYGAPWIHHADALCLSRAAPDLTPCLSSCCRLIWSPAWQINHHQEPWGSLVEHQDTQHMAMVTACEACAKYSLFRELLPVCPGAPLASRSEVKLAWQGC